MNAQTDARNSAVAKKGTDGTFELAMSYGWASSEAAWEPIITRASWNAMDARALLKMIELMEEAGIADLPRAAALMRNAARIANSTLRDAAFRDPVRPQVRRR